MDIGTRVRITRVCEVIGHILPQNRLDGSVDPDRPSLLVTIEGHEPTVLRLAPSDVVPLVSAQEVLDTICRQMARSLDVSYEQLAAEWEEIRRKYPVALTDADELSRAIQYALVADEGLQWLKSYAAGEPGAWEELNAWDGRTDRPKPATVRDMTHG